jgi:hypothetical protein
MILPPIPIPANSAAYTKYRPPILGAGCHFESKSDQYAYADSCLLWFLVSAAAYTGRPYWGLDATLNQSRTSTRKRTAVCYDSWYWGICCWRGISRFLPASPKSAFIKNEQKAKTKLFRSVQLCRTTTAHSPPIHRPWPNHYYTSTASELDYIIGTIATYR